MTAIDTSVWNVMIVFHHILFHVMVCFPGAVDCYIGHALESS